MQLIDIKEIKGKIVLKSGLHIGAGDTEMHIGGTDNPVVKHPHTQEPYIPGSSIKGKVRSLLEMESGLMVKSKGSPISADLIKKLTDTEKEKAIKIVKVFGTGGSHPEIIEELEIGPTRVSFSDCQLTKEWREKAYRERLSLTEVKSENSIDRITGTAQNPRFTERVPADVEFDFSVTLKLLGKNEDDLFDYLLHGLKLLQMDALGGSGSRGYGKVAFQFVDGELQSKFENMKLF